MENVVGSYVVSNNTSVNIYGVLHGVEDKVVFSWNSGRKCSAKIRYDSNGEPYFMTRNMKIYFNEVQRIL